MKVPLLDRSSTNATFRPAWFSVKMRQCLLETLISSMLRSRKIVSTTLLCQIVWVSLTTLWMSSDQVSSRSNAFKFSSFISLFFLIQIFTCTRVSKITVLIWQRTSISSPQDKTSSILVVERHQVSPNTFLFLIFDLAWQRSCVSLWLAQFLSFCLGISNRRWQSLWILMETFIWFWSSVLDLAWSTLWWCCSDISKIVARRRISTGNRGRKVLLIRDWSMTRLWESFWTARLLVWFALFDRSCLHWDYLLAFPNSTTIRKGLFSYPVALQIAFSSFWRHLDTDWRSGWFLMRFEIVYFAESARVERLKWAEVLSFCRCCKCVNS